jgi:hypothetical protein
LSAILMLLALSVAASAGPIFSAGDYPTLDENIARHERQFFGFNSLPFGLSLDAHLPDDAAKALVEQFLAQDASDDVRAVTGKHPFEILSSYGEYGDLGFFGGIAVAGTAYEYMTLKREGAQVDVLARARERVIRAAESWHIFYTVTGGDGVVARGVRRMRPENPDDPPIPGPDPDFIDLFDESGNPLPQPKNNGAYRRDNSSGLLPDGDWSWIDSCSKDQMVGQVFGMAALYDAMRDDPDIDQSLVTRMQEDARRVGQMLMTRREISGLEGPSGQGKYDLIIMDADGRPTKYHDLNPASLEGLYFEEGTSFNRFNTIMAIGIIEGLFHVSGDPELESYLYEDLLDERGFLDMLTATQSEGAIDYVYLGINTNWDDPDMTAIALWLGIYLERDPEVTDVLRSYLENGWWDREGESFLAKNAKQPLWNVIYMTLTNRGVNAALVDASADLLLGFSLGPYWNDQRINCDSDELAAGQCLAIDGKTILTIAGQDSGGTYMASEALHPSIRPPSNFNSRSNPFEVNGGGGNRLNPGGDLLAAYWIGRYMQLTASGEVNLSPFARSHMPLGGCPPGGCPQTDGGVNPDESDGCGCSLNGSNPSWHWIVIAFIALSTFATKRKRKTKPSSDR